MRHCGTGTSLRGQDILSRLDIKDLIGHYSQEWRLECEIIVDYMPPFPKENTKPSVVVYYEKYDSFLRYSMGPLQGYFWDFGGDDFHTVGLALLALIRSERPTSKPYVEFTIPLEKK